MSGASSVDLHLDSRVTEPLRDLFKFLVGGVVKFLSIILASNHDGLHHTLPVELLEVGYDTLGQAVRRHGLIDGTEGARNGTIKFQDVIIDLEQGLGSAGLPAMVELLRTETLALGKY